MNLLLPWLVFPSLLGVLSLGCGLLLREVSGDRLPAGLLLPSGFALMIVAASLTTTSAATASLTVPLVVALAVAGLGLTFPWRNGSADPWAVASSLGVYAVYAAPVVLSGKATIAGYIKLDDPSTFLAFTDRVMQHGRDVSGLAPSTFQAVVAGSSSYPIGAFLPLRIGSSLVGTDPVWLFQPFIAFCATMLALSLGALLVPLVRSRRLRAFAAFVAAQAALLYGYALWGGAKELAAAALIVCAGALAPAGADELRSIRRLIPFALSCAALLAVLDVSAGLWLLPLGSPAIIVVARHRTRRLVDSLLAGIGLIAVFSLQTLIGAAGFLGIASAVVSRWPLGNLIQPLNLLQIFGVWPAGDFRVWPSEHAVTKILVAVVAAAAIAALVISLRRRVWRLPLLVATVVVAALILERASTPWLAGKAYAIASPVLVLAALALVAILVERGSRVEGLLLAMLIAGGVFWSAALAYHDVWLAPRAQLRELELIGDRFAGQGPSLMTEYQPYGVRHFLRKMDAEGASELRVRPVYLTNGTMLGKSEFADLDKFATSGLLIYRTLVLHGSPVESRPPAPYELVWQGTYYEVWQRPDPSAPYVLEHLGLGDALHAAAVPACADVVRLGTVAANAAGRLVAAPRTNAVLLGLAGMEHPAGWSFDSTGQTAVPKSAGVLRGRIAVGENGRYAVWLGGSFARTVTISIDGRRVGSLSHVLTETGQWTPFGSLRLSAGSHTVTLSYGGSQLAPGSGAGPFALGPLALSPAQSGGALLSVSPAKARSLCGRTLDWVEAVGP